MGSLLLLDEDAAVVRLVDGVHVLAGPEDPEAVALEVVRDQDVHAGELILAGLQGGEAVVVEADGVPVAHDLHALHHVLGPGLERDLDTVHPEPVLEVGLEVGELEVDRAVPAFDHGGDVDGVVEVAVQGEAVVHGQLHVVRLGQLRVVLLQDQF